MGTLSSNYPDSRAVEAALDRANLAMHTVSEMSEDIDSIQSRLDDLEYSPIEINSFVANPSICELGSFNTINLSWTASAIALFTLNGIPVSGGAYTVTNVGSAQTYTLTATDGKTTDNKSIYIEFANVIYYGVAKNLSNVSSLSNQLLSNEKKRTINVNAGNDYYIVYALPKRLGTVSFKVDGFTGGFEPPREMSITNASGYTEVYYVYRSTNANLGTTTVEIRGV